LVLAFGLPIVAYGLLFSLWLCLVGGIIVVAGIYGWVMEPPDDPDLAHDDHEPHGHAGSGTAAASDDDAASDADVKEVETVG
jgi:cytochrome c oxidase subunit 1